MLLAVESVSTQLFFEVSMSCHTAYTTVSCEFVGPRDSGG